MTDPEETPAGLEDVEFPVRDRSPYRQLGWRLLGAVGILVFTVLVVFLDRAGYRDSADGRVSLIDAIYYTTVTLSTTGYGDITPVSDGARLINAFVITPLRIAFLVLLIGTTVEALTAQGRDRFRASRWRNKVENHVVIIGYGVKGRSAAKTLVRNGVDEKMILVVDPAPMAVNQAKSDGIAAIAGDATRRDVLKSAAVDRAKQVIITTATDSDTILSVLTARQLNKSSYIVAAAREASNVELVRQSGANAVITSSDAVGRLLGLSSVSPSLGDVMEDLLTYGDGLEVAEREVLLAEVGRSPQSLPDQVIAVVRDDKVYRYYEPTVTQLNRGDKLVVVRPAKERPWAPRPGTHHESISTDSD